MFINYTNHNSSGWGEKQKAEAEKYGEIVNFDFPNVSPELTKEELYQLANAECKKILALLDEKQARENSAVLCQGECALNFLIVKFLLSEKIKVVTAVTERNVEEVTHGEVVEKRSKFVFQKFRSYDDRMRQSENQPEKQPEKQLEIYPSVTRKNQKKDQDVILITAMGAGGYQTTVYEDENGNEIAATGYAFDAVVQKENPNKLLFIGTEKSDWGSLVKWYSKNKELSEKERAEGEALGELLKDEKTENRMKAEAWNKAETYICEHANFDEVKRALIPNGSNEKEQEEYFNTLFQSFKDMLRSGKKNRKSIRIILDISNGFRSIPLYMMMFIRYVGAISNEKITYTIYYGMFDARNRKKNTTPLVELSTVSELTDWMNAISEFRSMGSVKKLYQCLNMEKDKQKEPEKKEEIGKLITEFQYFDYALNSNNLYYLQKEIEFISNMEVEKFPLSAQAQLMLNDLREYFKKRFQNTLGMSEWRYSNILFAYAKMCVDQGRYGSAAVSLQEGILTYLMERYVKSYIQEKEELNDEEYKKYIQKYNNRTPVKEHLEKKKSAFEKGEENDFSERMQQFFRLYSDIKKYIRNVNAHIVHSDEVPNPETMADWLNQSIKLLTEDMEQYLTTDKSLGFSALYEDFQITVSSSEKKKAAAKLLKPTESGSWIFTDERKPELREGNKKVLCDAGIDVEKVDTLRKELLFLKKQMGKTDRLVENNLREIPLIRQILKDWIKQDGKVPAKDTMRTYLATRANTKGVVKSGYERLASAMQNNLLGIVIEALQEEE